MKNIFFVTNFCSLIELPLRRSVHLSVLYSAIQGVYPLLGGVEGFTNKDKPKGVGQKTNELKL